MSQAGMTEDVERFDPQGPPLRRIALEHRARYRLAAALAADRRVLDLGSGEGYGTAMIAKRGATQAVGLELALVAAARARRNYAASGACFVVANAHALPFADDAFELLISYEVIEHVLRPRQMLAEAQRVLASGGQIVVSTPNRLRTDEPSKYHLVEYSPDEFAELVGDAFPGAEVHGQHSLAQSQIGAEAKTELADADYLVATAPPLAGELMAEGRMAVSLADVEREFQGLLDHYVDLVDKVDRDRRNLRRRISELEELGAGVDADRSNQAARAAELEERLQRVDEDRQQLSVVLAGTEADRCNLRELLAAATADRDNLQHLLNEITADRDNLNHSLGELTADRDNLRHALGEITADRDNLRHALHEITADRDNLRHIADEANTDRGRLMSEVEELNAQLQTALEWQSKAEHLAGDLDTVLGSRAWRLLKALRIVKR